MTRKHVSIQHRGFVPGVDGRNATIADEPGKARFQSLGPLGEDGRKDWTIGTGMAKKDGSPDTYEFDIAIGESERIVMVLGSAEINGTLYHRGEEILVSGPNKVRMVFAGALACAYFCIFER